MENNGTTLITGASSGIGMHLAHEFAKHGHSLVLVAPVESELQRLQQELESEYGVSVRAIAKDLEKAEAAQEIFDEAGREVEILVNNAGHGQRGKFWEISLEEELSILRLNVEAVLRLTRLFLPVMVTAAMAKSSTPHPSRALNRDLGWRFTTPRKLSFFPSANRSRPSWMERA